MDANCFNLSLKDNRRLANEFGEIKTQELMNTYFPDYNPNYNEFITNKDIIKELNLKNLSQSNKVLGTSYAKEISGSQLAGLKKKISIKNNELNKQGASIVYKLYNNKQIGESDLYTWSLREIKGNLNIKEKIERAKTRGQFEQAKNLEQDNQLKLFQLSTQGTIKPGVNELFSSNLELANQVYETLGYKRVYQGYDTLDYRKINYFTVDKEEAKDYGKKIRSVILNLDKLLKGNSNQYQALVEEDNKRTGKRFDILDNSKEGLKKQEQFFNFLKKKGYSGIDLTMYSDTQYVVSFENVEMTPQQEQQAKQLYSQYLNTIFPDSKVKDIVYHGTDAKFDEFIRLTKEQLIERGYDAEVAISIIRSFYFTFSKKYAESIGKVVVSAIVDTKNPKNIEDITYETSDRDVNYSKEERRKFLITQIKDIEKQIKTENAKYIPTLERALKNYKKDLVDIDKNFDAFIGREYSSTLIKQKLGLKEEIKSIAVFEPEQIHILGSKQDIEGFKEFVSGKSSQQILPQLKSTKTDSKEIIEQIDKNLNDYIKNNNINIEFKNQVLDSNGNDVVAFYDDVKKVIEINEGKRDSKTLPEELAHHLHLALGKDHILVKRAFNLLNRVDYKAMLGQEYVNLYKNNTDLLKFELLGKLTASAVRGEKIPLQMNTVEGNKLWDTIKRMIDAVIKLFKPDVNVQKELDNLANEFADMLKSGVKVDSEKSIKTKMYQTNKDLINLSSKIKPVYVYYTTLLTALKKKQKQFSALSEEYGIIQNQINTIDITLRELVQNQNELPLLNLVDETITSVAQNINDFEINYSKGIMPSEKQLIETIEVLKKFSGFPGTESKVNQLKARLVNFIKPYLVNKSSKVLGKELTEEEVFSITNDVNILEKNFGTLARTEFTLSRMLGLLIKQKQNTIERENKEAFDKVQNATDKLKNWASSNGMSLEQAFDLLQQEYRGTKILTKEYTSEFYKLINDTYKLEGDKGKQERAKIAIWDAANKKWIPKANKYNNPNYNLIHKKGNEDLLNYYNFFKEQVQNVSDNVLPIELDDYFIPNVYEETLLDILKTQDSVGDKLKDSVIHILEFNPFEKMGTIDQQMNVIYDADLIGDKISLKYIQALPEDKKSKNLSAALLKFMYFANSYKHMNEILPIANLVEETITDPDASKILEYGNPSLNVAAKSNIVEMVKTIKDMQILGKMRKEKEMLNVLGFKMDYGKLIDFGLQYTSKIRLGLNPFAALANVAIGNLGNIIEAAGGKYFTLGEYFSSLGAFTTEGKKVDGLTNLFNPLMEMDDYENLKKLGVGSKEYREKINSLLYAPTRMGEKQMQTTTMIAILKHKQVDIKDKKGNVTGKISMWEAFDSEGKWDTAKMGYELNEAEINKITNRVHGVNQMIHGRYSAKDAAAMQQYAVFRALMQFKKWIPAAVEQRFMAKRYDPLLEEETEGRYWAYAKGLRLMMAKLKNDAKKIEENKFTELDWYNMRRNAMELLVTGLLFGLVVFLKAGDDDDQLKRNAGYKTYMRLLNSVSGDLIQWYLPGTFWDKAMTVPVTKTLRSLERTIQYTPYMFGDYSSDASGTYENGERKDENKFWSNFFNNVPFGSTTADMYRTWFKDDVSYVQRNR